MFNKNKISSPNGRKCVKVHGGGTFSARNKGFSLVELIVVIAIMAVLVAVLAPALLSYTERSRAQKDDAAMDEVVNAVNLSLADQDVYDECLMYAVKNNYSCYVDDKSDDDGSALYDDDQRLADESPYYLAGNMRGLTITFSPESNGTNKTEVDLSKAIINYGFSDGETTDEARSAEYINGTPSTMTLSTMTSGNGHNYLYNSLRSTVGDKITLSSQTYRNSDYTIFINLSTSNEPAVAYGQWNGTNLSANANNSSNDNRVAISNNYNGVNLPTLPNDVDYSEYKFAGIGIVDGVYMLLLSNEDPQYSYYSGSYHNAMTGVTSNVSGNTVQWNSSNTSVKIYALNGNEWAH